METNERGRRRRTWLRGSLCAIAALFAALILFAVLSPLPTCWLMRELFKHPTLAPPPGYGQMEQRVQALPDLTYPSLYRNNAADLYLPKDAPGPLPVILWAHGGGYAGGDKTDVQYYATALAAQGYAVVSVNYALAPEDHYPTPLLQMAEICHWLQSIREEHSLDMENLVLAGDSAGAHLAAQFALLQTSDSFAELCGLEPSIDPDNLRGLLLYCGPYDVSGMGDIGGLAGFLLHRAAWGYCGTTRWAEQYEDQLSIVDHMTESFPPVFLTDGNTGSFQSHGESLAKLLRGKGVHTESYFMTIDEEVTHHEYQFIMDTPAGIECFSRTILFLDSVLTP